jgi:hypothetical protein
MEHHFHGADIVRPAQIVYAIGDAFPVARCPMAALINFKQGVTAVRIARGIERAVRGIS